MRYLKTGREGAHDEVSGASPLAPHGITEPDLSDLVLFIHGEPVTGFEGDSV